MTDFGNYFVPGNATLKVILMLNLKLRNVPMYRVLPFLCKELFLIFIFQLGLY